MLAAFSIPRYRAGFCNGLPEAKLHQYLIVTLLDQNAG
jgi:hypothetical protein